MAESASMAQEMTPASVAVLHGSPDKRTPTNRETRPVAVTGRGDLRVKTTRTPGMVLAQKLLGTGDTLIFTADVAYEDVSVLVCNNSGADRTFQLHLVAKGGSSTNTNLISCKGQALGATAAPPKLREAALRPGQMLRGLCDSADGVSVTVKGTPV